VRIGKPLHIQVSTRARPVPQELTSEQRTQALEQVVIFMSTHEQDVGLQLLGQARLNLQQPGTAAC